VWGKTVQYNDIRDVNEYTKLFLIKSYVSCLLLMSISSFVFVVFYSCICFSILLTLKHTFLNHTCFCVETD
jgi:hypothetical protein